SPRSRPTSALSISRWHGSPSRRHGHATTTLALAACRRFCVGSLTPLPADLGFSRAGLIVILRTSKGAPAMSLARVQNFSISLDGFGTGEGQSRDAPFGHAGDRLHEWMFATRWWREMIGQPGGNGGIDDAF